MKRIFTVLCLLLTSFSFAQFIIGQPDNIIIVDSPFDGFATFNLTINEIQTLNGLSASVVNISYFISETDANENTNQIPNPESFINAVSPQTIYVRMELNNNPDSYQVASFNIIVEDDLIIGAVSDLVFYQIPLANTATFDLTEKNVEILNGIDPSTVSVQFFNSQADADTNTLAISNPENYTNTTNPETIFVRVELLSDSNFYTTTTFNLDFSDDVVNIPSGYFLSTIINQGVDTNNSGNIQSFEALAVTNFTIDDMVNNITGLEAFINIEELYSYYGAFASLDLSIFQNLEKLEIILIWGSTGNLDLSSNLNLKELTIFNTGLTTLDLSNNILLESLDLNETQISSLDLSNNTLLKELAVQSYSLASLDLNNNPNLESLSILGNTLLETVFIKNGADESANMDSGTWLENWLPPNNPSLQYVCADDFQVADIQQWAGTDYVVSSFCSSEPGGDFNTLSGTTQFDLNNDGCDVSDPVVPFVLIEAGPGPSTITPAVSSDENGVFNYYTGQPGNITLQPYLENPSYFNISPNFPNINIPVIDNSIFTQDFCLTASGNIADAEVVIVPIVPSQPGFDATYKLVYKNKGNQMLSGSVDFQYDDSVLDFVSSTETPDAQSTGLLSFNFIDLEPFESRAIEITLNVNDPMETPAINIDDVLDYISTIAIDQTEETPADNTFDYSETVVGAYDPNDITCLQGDLVPDTEIGEFLHYMIRFENTGNAPAQTVVVTTDINSADYETSTLQVLDASHNMSLRHNNGVIEFVFENIQLEGGGGHGNILLKIKTLPTLTIDDEVDIQADIYFDFNFPIKTNIAHTEFNTLSNSQFEVEKDFVIYPNPSDDELYIESISPIQTIIIFDVQGKIVLTLDSMKKSINSRIDVSGLSQGIYLIQLQTLSGRVIQKFVKE